jgi:hypothetical protein
MAISELCQINKHYGMESTRITHIFLPKRKIKSRNTLGKMVMEWLPQARAETRPVPGTHHTFLNTLKTGLSIALLPQNFNGLQTSFTLLETNVNKLLHSFKRK